MRFPSPSVSTRGQAWLVATAYSLFDGTVRSGISFCRGKLLEAAEAEALTQESSREREIAKFRRSVGALVAESSEIHARTTGLIVKSDYARLSNSKGTGRARRRKSPINARDLVIPHGRLTRNCVHYRRIRFGRLPGPVPSDRHPEGVSHATRKLALINASARLRFSFREDARRVVPLAASVRGPFK